MQQMTLIGTKHGPHATERMDIAIADFIFSNGLPISLVECIKFNKLIQSARHIPPKYTPPYRKNGRTVAGRYLSINHVFDIALFGDCATIQKVPMIIILGSSPNNPFELLDNVDCNSELAMGGKKMLNTLRGF
jgi:hypothetical protein